MSITDITSNIKKNIINGIRYNKESKTIYLLNDIIWDPNNYLTLSKNMIFDGRNFTISVLNSNNVITSTNYWSIISIDSSPSSFSNAPIIKNLNVKSVVAYQTTSTYSLAGIVSNAPYYINPSSYIPINYLRIYNCKHYGDVYNINNSLNIAGCAGIVGEIRNMDNGDIIIEDCYQYGNIYGYFCGGIVNSFCGAFSEHSKIIIDNCHSVSDDTNNNNNVAWGGIVGSFACISSDTKMYIKHCTFKGMIDNYSGGIVGLCACSYNGGSIYLNDCHSNATIGRGSGGICGLLACSGNITLDMYEAVDLDDYKIYYGNEKSTGGYIQLNNCYSIGEIGDSNIDDTNDSSGGLFGPMCCGGGNVYTTNNVYYSGGKGGKVKAYDCYSVGSIGFNIVSDEDNLLVGCSGLFASNACYGGNVAITNSPVNINGGTGGFIYLKRCYSHGSIYNASGGLFADRACYGGDTIQATSLGNGGTGGRIKIKYCHSIGEVSFHSGGLFGAISAYGGNNINNVNKSGTAGEITIKYCYSIGKISTNSGGFIGFISCSPTLFSSNTNYGSGGKIDIKNSYVLGNLSVNCGGFFASNTLYCDGFITTDSKIKVENCYFKGYIATTCGGIFGSGGLVIGSATIKNCYITDYYSKINAGPLYVPTTIPSKLKIKNVYTLDLTTVDQDCLDITKLYDNRKLPEEHWVKIDNNYPQLKNNLQNYFEN